jgi:exopolysaccharide production protein ExoZ
MDTRIGEVRPVGAVTPSRTQTLWTVQVMRGVAALMVVVGHSQSAVGAVLSANGSFTRSTLVPWGAGVDLFFVISGFIIVHASSRLFGTPGARREFLRRRLIRIVPLYWLVTTLFLLLLAAASLKGGDPFPDARAIFASYAFIPADTYGDGRLFPVFDLGWTLNYEMFFYALLALVVVWPRGRALTILGGLLVALVVAGMFVPGPSAPWYWTRPIIVDFGLGIAVGALVAKGIVVPKTIRAIVAVVAVALLLADPAHIFDGPVGTTVANAWPRVLLAGIPVALVLGAALLGPEPRMPRVGIVFTRIGDSSYSLYLFHPFALITMEKLAQKIPAVRGAPGWLLVAGTVAVAIAIALAAYRWIERPMTASLANLLAPRPTTAPSKFVAE